MLAGRLLASSMFHAGKQHEIDYISTGSMTCWHKGHNGFSTITLLLLHACWQVAGIFDVSRRKTA